jgi:ATP phosphoribosyltransferase regulatory subunit
MALADRWLLPDGVKEMLPSDARQIETLRRTLLDMYDRWGYELVMPPLMEHLESLLTGVGKDLDLNTFKLVDQLTGQSLGIRADITPQVARIDAHRMHVKGANRLCYCGSVLHTHPANMLASRNPLQIGAEVYGHAGIESDLEVISLMIETLYAVGLKEELSLDLQHIGIFRGLMAVCQLDKSTADRYMELLERKALPELSEFLAELDISAELKKQMASAEDVAFALHMSVSTLRRRLLDEGTSYQKIKDDSRKEAALNYMNSPQLSISDVASLMGFDEPSAFFRSFKKWTGMTPGEYRKSEAYQQQYDQR